MLLSGDDCTIGAHGGSKSVDRDDPRLVNLNRHLDSEEDCVGVVDEFVANTGDLDTLIVLSGRIHFSGHWMGMPSQDVLLFARRHAYYGRTRGGWSYCSKWNGASAARREQNIFALRDRKTGYGLSRARPGPRGRSKRYSGERNSASGASSATLTSAGTIKPTPTWRNAWN